jgi:hypothetical protein
MMIDVVSHYEHAATHVNVIIWSKDRVCVIKSLETTNLLKYVGIFEYYSGGNVKILGDS